jgi:hypothetical protein
MKLRIHAAAWSCFSFRLCCRAKEDDTTNLIVAAGHPDGQADFSSRSGDWPR